MSHKTYEIGYRRKKSWRLAILAILTIILFVGGYYIFKQFKADTAPVIKNSAGSTHAQVIPNSETRHFDQDTFAFDLPADWKLIKHDTAPYNLFSYHSTVTNADNRYLDIYVDTLPITLAVNKSVAVKAQGNNLSHGMASDNCTTFTAGAAQPTSGAKPLSFLAKWDGVEFICDNDTLTRNVIGTSAPGTVNKVTLASPTSASHSFFYVYTDNNSTPDYTIFYHMLESFIVK